MPSRPLSQPVLVTTFRLSAGVGSSWPLRMMRTRPGRSVSQIVPSAANASAHGATRPSATDLTMKFSGWGDVMLVAFGVAVGRGDDVVAVDEPPIVQPLSARLTRTAPAIRWGIVLMLAAQEMRGALYKDVLTNSSRF